MGEFFYNMIFVAIVALTMSSAIVVVTARNIVRSAFSLLFTLAGVAGLFAYLGADFLAATQLVVYVGGILVLILFGVMLTHKITSVELVQGNSRQGWSAVIFVGLIYVLWSVFSSTDWPIRGADKPFESTVEPMGLAFMTDHLLPFEVASVLLLAALVGAVLITRREVRE